MWIFGAVFIACGQFLLGSVVLIFFSFIFPFLTEIFTEIPRIGFWVTFFFVQSYFLGALNKCDFEIYFIQVIEMCFPDKCNYALLQKYMTNSFKAFYQERKRDEIQKIIQNSDSISPMQLKGVGGWSLWWVENWNEYLKKLTSRTKLLVKSIRYR